MQLEGCSHERVQEYLQEQAQEKEFVSRLLTLKLLSSLINYLWKHKRFHCLLATFGSKWPGNPTCGSKWYQMPGWKASKSVVVTWMILNIWMDDKTCINLVPTSLPWGSIPWLLRKKSGSFSYVHTYASIFLLSVHSCVSNSGSNFGRRDTVSFLPTVVSFPPYVAQGVECYYTPTDVG